MLYCYLDLLLDMSIGSNVSRPQNRFKTILQDGTLRNLWANFKLEEAVY